MKKITFTTLCLLAFVFTTYSQTFSTGTIILSNTSGLEYSAKIDITASEVTLTLIGPADRYLSLGLGVQSMTNNGDVVMYLNGTTLSDRTFGGVGVVPSADSNQDWSTVSNVTSGGVRTLISTRALNTGEANDYVFSTLDTSIDLVWARGNSASFALVYHGAANRGITSSGITLGTERFELTNNFKIYPNPGSTAFNIELLNNLTAANLEVYDILGKQVYAGEVSEFNYKVNVSQWNSGIYLVKVSNEISTQTKKFIKQ
ncbi:MAG: T9SS type A sorting domain-containing protein [Flavobacteriaceae bacterium]|nr:T9SS type A sorting domain-containing protein [Flavobacteriaceae bacterium]